MRISTFFTVLMQSSKSFSFNEFCKNYMPFAWDIENEDDTPAPTFTLDDYNMMANLGKNAKKVGDISLEEIDKMK